MDFNAHHSCIPSGRSGIAERRGNHEAAVAWLKLAVEVTCDLRNCSMQGFWPEATASILPAKYGKHEFERLKPTVTRRLSAQPTWFSLWLADRRLGLSYKT